MKHKIISLTKEEREFEKALNNGEYPSSVDFKREKAKIEAAARYTLEKTRTISIYLA